MIPMPRSSSTTVSPTNAFIICAAPSQDATMAIEPPAALRGVPHRPTQDNRLAREG
jgi:hypothetical protein